MYERSVKILREKCFESELIVVAAPILGRLSCEFFSFSNYEPVHESSRCNKQSYTHSLVRHHAFRLKSRMISLNFPPRT
jgi:hypothetical protein